MMTWSFMNGSMNMSNLRSSVLLLFVMLSPVIYAADREQEQGQDTSATPELLEFLGDWETGTGEWIDPMEFEDDYYVIQTSRQDEADDE